MPCRCSIGGLISERCEHLDENRQNDAGVQRRYKVQGIYKVTFLKSKKLSLGAESRLAGSSMQEKPQSDAKNTSRAEQLQLVVSFLQVEIQITGTLPA